MKTTNKLFKVQVQEHIIGCLSTDYTTDTKEQLENVVEAFLNWYSPYERKMTPNIQDAFIEFLNGLPSELSVEYTFYAQNNTMKKWFENCCEVYKESTFEKWEKLDKTYNYLIYREFNTLCKQHNVPFLERV